MKKLVIDLHHGRSSVDEELDDWGFEGPMLEIDWYHTTYDTTRRIRFTGLNEEYLYEYFLDEILVEGMICYDGNYYGDWTIALIDSTDSEYIKRVEVFDESKFSQKYHDKFLKDV